MKISSKFAKRALSVATVIAVGVAFSTAGTSPSDAQMSDITKERKAAMKSMGGNIKKLGGAVAGGDSAAAAAAANAINAVASRLPSLFPEGSGSGETLAKPEIWQDFTDFRVKANALETATAKVVAAAATDSLGSDPKAVVGSIGKTCGACHKVYRTPPAKK